MESTPQLCRSLEPERRRSFACIARSFTQVNESFPTPCQPFQNSNRKAESTYPRRSLAPDPDYSREPTSHTQNTQTRRAVALCQTPKESQRPSHPSTFSGLPERTLRYSASIVATVLRPSTAPAPTKYSSPRHAATSASRLPGPVLAGSNDSKANGAPTACAPSWRQSCDATAGAGTVRLR